MNQECEELKQKYFNVLEMLKESFFVFKNEIDNCQREKEKKKAIIISYKKRITEQMKEFQHIIDSQEEIINSYKKQNLELTKENILLKNKFKKVASSFTKNKQDKLISNYFKNNIELEEFLNYVVTELLKKEFNPKKISPLYFRKEFNNILNIYLIKKLNKYTKIEKISILLSSILMSKFSDKIYFFVASFLIDRIESRIYSNFIQILLTKTLVDKDKKYEPIQMEYSIDAIKTIYSKYKRLSFKKKDLFMKMDLEKVDKDISNCLEKINTDEKILEELTKKENDILLKLTTLEEENKEEEKKELEKIDSQKRIILDDISKLKKELEALKNKKLFLEPVNEVVFDNSLKDREKEIVEKYNNMVYNFSDALQRDLK
jgi:hypothetical protein